MKALGTLGFEGKKFDLHIMFSIKNWIKPFGIQGLQILYFQSKTPLSLETSITRPNRLCGNLVGKFINAHFRATSSFDFGSGEFLIQFQLPKRSLGAASNQFINMIPANSDSSEIYSDSRNQNHFP